MKKFLLRLDDASPWMNKEKWGKIENILNKFEIKPLVGIIPNNEDSQTKINIEDSYFWHLAKIWQDKKWVIALHGFNHVYTTKCGGINPVHKRSEFAGLDYKNQAEKIRKGNRIFIEKGIYPTYFYAPSHTYDDTTLKALKTETQIRLVSDTIALKPYKYDKNFIIVPCQMGKFRKIIIPGYWTFCFHPNIMSDNEINEFEKFIKENKSLFISFKDIPLENIKGKSLLDKLLSTLYFTKRTISKMIKDLIIRIKT